VGAKEEKTETQRLEERQSGTERHGEGVGEGDFCFRAGETEEESERPT